MASLREELRDAIEKTKQLQREGEAAATAAEITAEQRATDSAAVVDALKLQLSAAEERANVAVAAAKAAAATAAAESSSLCDAIRKAEAAAEVAEEQAAAALGQARAEEERCQALTLELAAARGQTQALADMNAEHAEASARLEAEQGVPVEIQLLGQKLDALLGSLRDNIASVPDDRMVDKSGVPHCAPVPDREVGGDEALQEGAAARVREAERLIAVVNEAAALTDGLREALVSTGQEVCAVGVVHFYCTCCGVGAAYYLRNSSMACALYTFDRTLPLTALTADGRAQFCGSRAQVDETAMELDAALAEVYCLRSHNAMLEETIAKVHDSV